MNNDICYAVDLDGTLASYSGWKNDRSVGPVIPSMMERVKMWIDEGIRIVIFTARADDPDNIPEIVEWLKKHGLEDLEISNIKTPDMARFYDDRAIQVEKNTGKIIGDESILEDWVDEATFKLQQIYEGDE